MYLPAIVVIVVKVQNIVYIIFSIISTIYIAPTVTSGFFIIIINILLLLYKVAICFVLYGLCLYKAQILLGTSKYYPDWRCA